MDFGERVQIWVRWAKASSLPWDRGIRVVRLIPAGNLEGIFKPLFSLGHRSHLALPCGNYAPAHCFKTFAVFDVPLDIPLKFRRPKALV